MKPAIQPMRKPFVALGALSALGALVYELAYVVTLSPVTPAMLVSGSFGSLAQSRWFAISQLGGVFLYSGALLPVVVGLTIRQYAVSPAGMAVGGSAMGLALIMEFYNTLPSLVRVLYPAQLIPPPPEMAAYLHQTNWIRFIAYDVSSFTLMFGAGVLYAFLFRRRFPLLAWCTVGSVVVFLLHLPVLWIAPRVAVALMGLSVCIAGATPLLLGRLAQAELGAPP